MPTEATDGIRDAWERQAEALDKLLLLAEGGNNGIGKTISEGKASEPKRLQACFLPAYQTTFIFPDHRAVHAVVRVQRSKGLTSNRDRKRHISNSEYIGIPKIDDAEWYFMTGETDKRFALRRTKANECGIG